MCDIYKAYVINLEERKDRMIQWLNDWDHIIKVERFNAYKHINGHIGCSLSHINAIRKGFEGNNNIVIIFEDDCKPFGDISSNYFDIILNELNSKWDQWEVTNLSCVMYEPYEQFQGINISDNFIQIIKTHDTSVVHSHISVYSRSVLEYINEYEQYILNNICLPIDRFHFKKSWGAHIFPKIRTWLSKKICGFQTNQYSNISNNVVLFDNMNNYGIKSLKFACNNTYNKSYVYSKNTSKIRSKIAIVTALYPIKSKEPINFYLEKCKYIIEKVSTHIIIFTTPEISDLIKKIRPVNWPLTIIDNYNSTWKYANLFSDNIFEEQSYRASKCSGKNITPELLKLYFQKTDFVNYVINNLNLISKYYIWLDIGSFRNTEWLGLLDHWPSYSKVKSALNRYKICFQKRIHSNEYNNINILKDCHITRSPIGGSCILATTEGWKLLDNLIYKEVLRVSRYNILWAYDEFIYYNILQNYTEDVTYYMTNYTHDDMHPENTWFGCYYVLSDATSTHNILGNYCILTTHIHKNTTYLLDNVGIRYCYVNNINDNVSINNNDKIIYINTNINNEILSILISKKYDIIYDSLYNVLSISKRCLKYITNNNYCTFSDIKIAIDNNVFNLFKIHKITL